jgi:alanine racemase
VPVAEESRPRAEAVVDLAAVRANVMHLQSVVAPAQLLVVVKAQGYGHGALGVARAARQAGAQWLGVAVLEEALALRAAGDTGRVLCWLAVPGEDYAPAVAADVDVTASSVRQLEEIVAAAESVARTARVQLKVDTGLSRNGAPPAEWPALVRAARDAQLDDQVDVTGTWSHLACSDDVGHPSLGEQERAFEQALGVCAEEGLDPGLRHLANSAAALTRPSARYDLARCGLAAYGLSPAPEHADAAGLGLRPVMTLRGRLALVKAVPAGSGVSYGHTHVTSRATVLGLVPLGYGDGVPRHASSAVDLFVGGRRVPLVGRVCMDQVVVDLGPDATDQAGDEVVLFGAGLDGEPTAQEWAEAVGTISYEIVTRIGPRVPRTYAGATSPEESG